MVQDVAGTEEVADLTFKQITQGVQLRLSPDAFDIDALPKGAKLLAVTNRFGWLAAVQQNAGLCNTLILVKLTKVRETFAQASKGSIADVAPDFTLTLPSSIHFVRFACSDAVLALALQDGKLVTYTLQDILNGKQAPFLTENVGPLLQLEPNPSDRPELVAFLTIEGQIGMLNCVTKSLQAAFGSHLTSMNWSARGKQLICGTEGGSLFQYTPDGQEKDQLPAPKSLEGAHSVIDVQWLENDLFLVVLAGNADDVASLPAETSIFAVSRSKATGVSYTAFEDDPTAPMGAFEMRPPCRMTVVFKNWQHFKHLAIAVSNAGSQMAVVGLIESEELHWATLSVDDASRPSLPLAPPDSSDTCPVGLDVDLTADEGIQTSACHYPANPVLLAYTSAGLLVAWLVQSSSPYAGIRAPELLDTSPLALQGKEASTSANATSALPDASATISKPSNYSTTFAPSLFEGVPSQSKAFGQSSFGKPSTFLSSSQSMPTSNITTPTASTFSAFASQRATTFASLNSGRSDSSTASPFGQPLVASSVSASPSFTSPGTSGFGSFAQSSSIPSFGAFGGQNRSLSTSASGHREPDAKFGFRDGDARPSFSFSERGSIKQEALEDDEQPRSLATIRPPGLDMDEDGYDEAETQQSHSTELRFDDLNFGNPRRLSTTSPDNSAPLAPTPLAMEPKALSPVTVQAGREAVTFPKSTLLNTKPNAAPKSLNATSSPLSFHTSQSFPSASATRDAEGKETEHFPNASIARTSSSMQDALDAGENRSGQIQLEASNSTQNALERPTSSTFVSRTSASAKSNQSSSLASVLPAPNYDVQAGAHSQMSSPTQSQLPTLPLSTTVGETKNPSLSPHMPKKVAGAATLTKEPLPVIAKRQNAEAPSANELLEREVVKLTQAMSQDLTELRLALAGSKEFVTRFRQSRQGLREPTEGAANQSEEWSMSDVSRLSNKLLDMLSESSKIKGRLEFTQQESSELCASSLKTSAKEQEVKRFLSERSDHSLQDLVLSRKLDAEQMENGEELRQRLQAAWQMIDAIEVQLDRLHSHLSKNQIGSACLKTPTLESIVRAIRNISSTLNHHMAVLDTIEATARISSPVKAKHASTTSQRVAKNRSLSSTSYAKAEMAFSAQQKGKLLQGTSMDFATTIVNCPL